MKQVAGAASSPSRRSPGSRSVYQCGNDVGSSVGVDALLPTSRDHASPAALVAPRICSEIAPGGAELDVCFELPRGAGRASHLALERDESSLGAVDLESLVPAQGVTPAKSSSIPAGPCASRAHRAILASWIVRNSHSVERDLQPRTLYVVHARGRAIERSTSTSEQSVRVQVARSRDQPLDHHENKRARERDARARGVCRPTPMLTLEPVSEVAHRQQGSPVRLAATRSRIVERGSRGRTLGTAGRVCAPPSYVRCQGR